uniref:Uncharacterized protein n=1 Tax=Cacopsylla melanoneura TaxID=428564 RepID=A0A8D9ARC9_9HEMI
MDTVESRLFHLKNRCFYTTPLKKKKEKTNLKGIKKWLSAKFHEILQVDSSQHVDQNYNVESIEVIGLLVGARGTITKHNMKEFKIKFNLPKKIFEEIVVSILIKRFNENNELPFIPSKKKMTFKHND